MKRTVLQACYYYKLSLCAITYVPKQGIVVIFFHKIGSKNCLSVFNSYYLPPCLLLLFKFDAFQFWSNMVPTQSSISLCNQYEDVFLLKLSQEPNVVDPSSKFS